MSKSPQTQPGGPVSPRQQWSVSPNKSLGKQGFVKSPRKVVKKGYAGRALPPPPQKEIVFEFPSSFSETELDLVIAQTSCSRQAAFDALEKSQGDVIDALLLIGSTDQDQEPVVDKSVDWNVELIMVSSGCSKELAVNALEKHDGDIVNALLGLQELISEQEEDEAFSDKLGDSLKKLSSSEDRRFKILEEMTSSEKTYCDGLQALQSRFIAPLSVWSESNSEKEIFVSFRTLSVLLEKVIDKNLPLLQRFQECLKQYKIDTNVSIGNCFQGIENFADDYANYVEFAQKLFKSLDEWEENHMLFKNELNALNKQARETKLFDLRSYVITPVQRCPRYLLFLKDLARSMNDEHFDFSRIKESHTQCEIVNRSINRHLIDASNTNKMKELSKQFAADPNLISSSRKLIKEGLLLKKCDKGGKKKTRKMYLFSDLLAYAKPFGTKFKLCDKFPLKSVRIQEAEDVEDDNAFLIKMPAKSLTFYASNIEEKMGWMLGITNAVAELKMNEKETDTKLSLEMENSPDLKSSGKRSPRGRATSFGKNTNDEVSKADKRSPRSRKGSIGKLDIEVSSPIMKKSPLLRKHNMKSTEKLRK